MTCVLAGETAAGPAHFFALGCGQQDSSASCSVFGDIFGTKRVKIVCDAWEQMMRETEINIGVVMWG